MNLSPPVKRVQTRTKTKLPCTAPSVSSAARSTSARTNNYHPRREQKICRAGSASSDPDTPKPRAREHEPHFPRGLPCTGCVCGAAPATHRTRGGSGGQFDRSLTARRPQVPGTYATLRPFRPLGHVRRAQLPTPPCAENPHTGSRGEW